MSTMTYNGITLTPWRTLSVNIEPVYTQDKADVLYHRYTIEGTCVANPMATVGGNLSPVLIGGGGGGNFLTAGNLDLNVAQLRRALLEPRQNLTFSISDEPNSFLVRSPALQPNGLPLPMDCDNGPHPEYCRILQVWGTQSALIAYRITTSVNNGDNVLLSNRWALSHSIDANGFTTRVQRGRAYLRSDLAWFWVGADDAWILDQFRQWFFLPPPATFRRTGVEVTASSDGLAYDYTVTDREVRYGTGGNGGITRIDGHVTSGYKWPQETAGQAAKAAWDTTTEHLSLPFAFLGPPILAPFRLWGGIKEAAGNALARLPNGNAMAVIRVFGQRNADMYNMAQVAIQAAIDRLSPNVIGFGLIPFLNSTPVFHSAYLTQSLDSDGPPFVQLTVTAMTSVLNTLKFGASDITNLPAGQNMNPSITIKGGTNIQRDAPTIQALPASSGTRGTYLGSLFVQALKSGPDALPGVPPIDVAAPDAREML